MGVLRKAPRILDDGIIGINLLRRTIHPRASGHLNPEASLRLPTILPVQRPRSRKGQPRVIHRKGACMRRLGCHCHAVGPEFQPRIARSCDLTDDPDPDIVRLV
jgi:hypothetical protein